MTPLNNNERFLLFLVMPQLLLILATLIVFMTGHEALAWTIQTVGLPLLLALVAAWIVFINPRKRWPEATPLQRLGRVLTFQR